MSQDIGPGDILIARYSDGQGYVFADHTYICREIARFDAYRTARWHVCSECGEPGEVAVLLVGNHRWGYCHCLFRKRGPGEEIERQLFADSPALKFIKDLHNA